MKPALHLRVVGEPPPAGGPARASARSEVGLVAFLFGVSVLPVAGELAHVGRWSPSIVGFAAGALVLSGRELWSQLRARRPPNTER